MRLRVQEAVYILPDVWWVYQGAMSGKGILAAGS